MDVTPSLNITVENLTLAAIGKHGLLAVFGALAHAINAHRTGKSKGLLDFVLLMIMSSFSGVLFALVSLQLYPNEYITLAAAGSGGFLGVEGLTFISNRVRMVLSNALNKKV